MTTHMIPKAGWPTALANTIDQCEDGDTIIVHTEAMLELGQIAQARMCPEKSIAFEIKQSKPIDVLAPQTWQSRFG